MSLLKPSTTLVALLSAAIILILITASASGLTQQQNEALHCINQENRNIVATRACVIKKLGPISEECSTCISKATRVSQIGDCIRFNYAVPTQSPTPKATPTPTPTPTLTTTLTPTPTTPEPTALPSIPLDLGGASSADSQQHSVMDGSTIVLGFVQPSTRLELMLYLLCGLGAMYWLSSRQLQALQQLLEEQQRQALEQQLQALQQVLEKQQSQAPTQQRQSLQQASNQAPTAPRETASPSSSEADNGQRQTLDHQRQSSEQLVEEQPQVPSTSPRETATPSSSEADKGQRQALEHQLQSLEQAPQPAAPQEPAVEGQQRRALEQLQSLRHLEEQQRRAPERQLQSSEQLVETSSPFNAPDK